MNGQAIAPEAPVARHMGGPGHAKPITKAMRRALAWLASHGGQAELDRYARVVARGRVAPGATGTWLRLAASGYVAPGLLPGGIGITVKGLDAADGE